MSNQLTQNSTKYDTSNKNEIRISVSIGQDVDIPPNCQKNVISQIVYILNKMGNISSCEVARYNGGYEAAAVLSGLRWQNDTQKANEFHENHKRSVLNKQKGQASQEKI